MNNFLFLKILKSLQIVGITLVLLQLSIGVSLAKPVLQSPSAGSLIELKAFIGEFSKENNIPGTAVAVASKGELVFFHAYGMANVELSVPVSDKTVFEIGSISKQFVSAAAMLLVEEKRLKVSDPIHLYLPFCQVNGWG
jgi:CubicO group peptidase (beta-lactamase class C family)